MLFQNVPRPSPRPVKPRLRSGSHRGQSTIFDILPLAEDALRREFANIDSVHIFENGMIMTFDHSGHQMPAFQGKAAAIVPLLTYFGWTGDIKMSALREAA